MAQWVRLVHLTAHSRLSPIRPGFAPGFTNYKKRCTGLAAASDNVCQLLAHSRWFSLGTPASSTTKTGRHDIAEILLKVTLKKWYSGSGYLNHILCNRKMVSRVSNKQSKLSSSWLELTKKNQKSKDYHLNSRNYSKTKNSFWENIARKEETVIGLFQSAVIFDFLMN